MFMNSKSYGPALLLVLAAANPLLAVNALTATPASITLTCNTLAGAGSNATVVVKPATALTGSATIAVTLGTLPVGVVAITSPATQTLTATNQTAGLSYVVNYVPGCAGATAGSASPTFHFTAGGVTDVVVTASTTVTAAATALAAAPSSGAVTCVKSGSTYTPAPAQTISVTSAASGGTPFTVDTVTSAPAAWLVVTPTTGGSAGTSPLTFTLRAASGCGGFATGTTNTTTVHLLNVPAPDKTLSVTLQVLSPTPLIATPATPKLSYTKGSGTAGYVDVAVSASTTLAPFFSIDTTSLPIWLTVDAISGKTPRSIRFSSTSVADSLAPGTYSATVNLAVAGSGNLAVPITLLVTNPAPRLTVAEGTTRNLTWTVGQASPTPVITAVSTDSPIPYVATTAGSLAPVISTSQQNGLAYSFGTQIGITFDQTVLAAAQPGAVLTGTVTLTWGNPASTTVVTFNITVQSPGAALTAVSPASLPTAASGQNFTVVLSGTGFIASADTAQRTRVGVVVAGVMTTDNNIAWNVVNPSSIILTISVPVGTDANLPFSTSGLGGSVNLGVCNPAGGSCTVPTGTATLIIASGPIVQVVTSASSFIQVNPGSTPTVAPHDIVTIFGTNFCSSGGTGCSSSQVLYPTPDGALHYPITLSPDPAGISQRLLSVKFQTHGGTPALIANASLLFANNTQINLLVPSGVAARIGSLVDVVVTFGFGTGATMLSSAAFPVNIAATNPGVFTVGADGQGQAAVLNSVDYSLIAPGNEAGMRSTASHSDTVLFYVTGLGAPDSTASNASAGSASWSADCITTASYLTSLNAQTGGALTAIDGLIIQSALLNTGRLSPCIVATSPDVPTITVGGVAATVTYAGWVADSIGGLYQMNVKMPGSAAGPFTDPSGATVAAITAPVSLPVVVTANGRTSQAGVTMWVAPRLKVVAPATLAGTVGTAWASSNNAITATEGTSPYRFAVTSGLLPSGLALSAANGQITGIPAANTGGSYAVTVTATDSANIPVSDSVIFKLSIAGGLVLATTGTSPYSVTYGAGNASVTTASATGGIYPYVFAITAPATPPVGMTVNPATGLVGVSALTPAGTYHVTITATDSTTSTALTGSATFDIVVALSVVNTAPTAGTHSQVNANLATVSATGSTGTVTYAFDIATAATAWLAIDPATGIVSTTNAAVAGTKSVTVLATDGTTAPHAASAGVGAVTFTITIN